MKTIAIPIFDDRTSEFGIDQALNDELIKAFNEDNTLKIADPRNADTILEGTIRNVRYQAGAYSANEQVEDIKVYISVNVKFTDLRLNEVVWEQQLTQWGTYNPDDPTATDLVVLCRVFPESAVRQADLTPEDASSHGNADSS